MKDGQEVVLPAMDEDVQLFEEGESKFDGDQTVSLGSY